MRSRPIGPGIGGLYYSPLLQDAHSTVDGPSRGARSGNSIPEQRSASAWQAVVAVLGRAAQRLVQARMAQAQRYVDSVQRELQVDAPASSAGAASRYYY